MTKSFIEQALRHLMDATVSDALLWHLLDPIMDERLTLAYAKLDELLAVHKEHPETRNPHFLERYSILQRNQWTAKTTKMLEEAFEKNDSISATDIPRLLALLHHDTKTYADLATAKSTFNTIQAFYQVFQACIYHASFNNAQFRSL